VTGGYPAAQVYRAALDDGDAGIRAAAASGLGLSFPEPAVLDRLAALAKKDEAAGVRAAAAATLARCGRERDVVVVAAACSDKDASVRKAAVKALVPIRTQAAAQALAAVITNKDEDRDTRVEAMRPAADFEHPKLCEALVKALDDRNEDIRYSAYATLCSAGIPETLTVACEKSLKDASPHAASGFVVLCWNFALTSGHFPDLRRKLVSTLVEALSRKESGVRNWAARSLRDIGFWETAEQLGALAAGEANEETKQLICRALWRDTSEEATAVFIELLDDKSEIVSRTAAQALKERADERIAPAALKLLPGAKQTMRQLLVELVAGSTAEEALKVLRGLLHTGSVKEKVTVIQGAQRKRNRALCPELAELLDSQDRSARLAAVSALGTLKYEPAVKKLAALADKARDEGVRYFMVKALAEIGTAESVGIVLKHFGGFSPPRQQPLALALAKLTDPKAIEMLRNSPVHAQVEKHRKSQRRPGPRMQAALRRYELLAKYKSQSAKELRSLAEVALSKSDPRRPAENWETVLIAMADAWPKEALACLREVTKEYPHWPAVMAATARVMQQHPLDGGEEILKTLLYRPNAFIHASAASALAKTPKGIAILTAAMESGHRLVSNLAFSALAKAGKLPEENLVKGLAHPDWSIRECAVAALVKSADLAEADWLSATLGNENPVVRRTISKALAGKAMTALPEAVKKAFGSDRRTRYLCLYSTAVHSSDPSAMAPYLTKYGLDAAVAAAMAHGEELLALVAKMLSDPESAKSAAQILEFIAPGENRDAAWWKKWLNERKPQFRWSEQDCRFLPENESPGR
jgi:HEAT repeat protein